MKEDKAYNAASKNKKIGIVGESHIWDGPLSQDNRQHAPGSSSGINGMEVSKYPTKAYPTGTPITSIAQANKGGDANALKSVKRYTGNAKF
tara:strand:- start:12940 stop:13212 length:273 start_codon:yes stop_codon:yes gene_type:complete